MLKIIIFLSDEDRVEKEEVLARRPESHSN